MIIMIRIIIVVIKTIMMALIMTMTIIRSEHGIDRFEFVKEVHATILNGEVRFFFSC